MQIFLWDVEVIATQQQPWNKNLLMSLEKNDKSRRILEKKTKNRTKDIHRYADQLTKMVLNIDRWR